MDTSSSKNSASTSTSFDVVAEGIYIGSVNSSSTGSGTISTTSSGSGTLSTN